MKKLTFALIFVMSLFAGKVAAQCTVAISGGTLSICYNTSPGTFTATVTGDPGPFTYLWYNNTVSTGITTQTYSPGNLTGTTSIYCTVNGGVCGTGTSATTTITVIPNASISSVTGTTPICDGAIATYSANSVVLGGGTGTWSSNNTAVATVSSSGLVTGVSGGTCNIIYTITGGCGGTVSALQPVTVTSVASIGSITGTSPLCDAGTTTYTANLVVLGGGTGAWSSSNPAIATVNSSGLVTGVAAGTCNIIYTITGGCGGTVSALKSITISPGASVASVTGTSPLCTGSSTTYTANSVVLGGGTGAWSSSNTGIATVNSVTGQVTGVAAGTCNIIFTISGGCGLASASASITISAIPSASISYTGSPWCTTAGVQNVTLTGTSGGTYTAPAGLSIDPGTGAITTSTSSAGTYIVTYTISGSGGCGVTTATTQVTISPISLAPVLGGITQPTCSVATGSVVLNGLPASGTWTVTRTPGSVTTSGSGPSVTISALPAGTYTFTVTNAAGCISPASANVIIDPQPASPAAPVQSVDCNLGFGFAVVTVTSPVGVGLEYSLDGGTYQTLTVFTLVSNGSHYLSVRNASGCTTTGTLFTVTCGCINPPTVALSVTTGNTCGTTAITVTGNTFGGSATSVAITHNGAGSVVPVSSTVSPFQFTYTPAAADGGKAVLITVTSNNPVGGLCLPGVATYTLTVNAMPPAPTIGTITNLTCAVGTGSVVLNGLPAAGTWSLTRNPGAIITSGSGTSTTVSGLAAGTYNFSVTSAEGCASAISADAVVSPAPSAPSAPVVGTITQPTCATSTGSVVLSGLPATGTWTLTRSPGSVIISGSGISTTISAIPAGATYTFTVTNSTGCVSSPSGNVVINTQPSIPSAPLVGTITPPTCTLATGSAVLAGLPSVGTWTLIRYPGTVSTTGTGVSSTITGLATGSYNFTVTTSEGCLSVPSANLIIPAQPPTPSAPVVGTITQPTFEVPTGSVVLSGLPSTGVWVITRLPGAATTTGTGTSRTISNLEGGVFTFTVTNSAGCISTASGPVTISTPGAPVLTITNPPAVCSPATVDLTATAITAGSTTGLTFTYWTDAAATIPYTTPTTAVAGIYYIKGTTVSGYFNIKPVTVTIDPLPVPNAGTDQTLYYQTSTTLDAISVLNQTGIWSVESGTATFSNNTDPKTTVSDLSSGDNLLLWSVKTGVCPVVVDTVNIIVKNILIPTLITPNWDGRNDNFVIKGLASLGKTELIIFDRRGAEVYKNTDYDNSWNGVDFNKHPLPDDTYFYVLKSEQGKAISGYIVIRH
jgi:gliding motility-associated-like protein